MLKAMIVCSTMLFLNSAIHARPVDDTVKDLHNDIVLINLLDGLYLSESQRHGLIDLIQEAEAARKSFTDQIRAVEKEDAEVLKALKTVRLQGREASPELKKQVGAMKEVHRRAENQLGKVINRLENKAAALMTENQRITLETFKPCLIPSAPGRVGQETGEAGMHLIERIRQYTPSQWTRVQPMVEDKYIERFERHYGRLNDAERDSVVLQLNETARQARTLPDSDFMLQKQALGESVKIPDRVRSRQAMNTPGKTGRLLLDPALLTLLKK